MPSVEIDAGTDMGAGTACGRYLIDDALNPLFSALDDPLNPGNPIGTTFNEKWYPMHYFRVRTFEAITLSDVDAGNTTDGVTSPDVESLWVENFYGDPPYNYVFADFATSLLQLNGIGTFVGYSYSDPNGTDPQYIDCSIIDAVGNVEFPLYPEDTRIIDNRVCNNVLLATLDKDVFAARVAGEKDRPSATYVTPSFGIFALIDAAQIDPSGPYATPWTFKLRFQVWQSRFPVNWPDSYGYDFTTGDFYWDSGFAEYPIAYDGSSVFQRIAIGFAPDWAGQTPDWLGADFSFGCTTYVKISREASTETIPGPDLIIDKLEFSF